MRAARVRRATRARPRARTNRGRGRSRSSGGPAAACTGSGAEGEGNGRGGPDFRRFIPGPGFLSRRLTTGVGRDRCARSLPAAGAGAAFEPSGANTARSIITKRPWSRKQWVRNGPPMVKRSFCQTPASCDRRVAEELAGAGGRPRGIDEIALVVAAARARRGGRDSDPEREAPRRHPASGRRGVAPRARA